MKKIVFIFSIFILAGGNFFIFAQNSDAVQSATPSLPRGVEISYGTFVKASPAEVVLLEYDAEKDANTDVVYVVNADSKFTNVSGVDKIPVGANIDIYYSLIDDKKTVKNLVVELPESADAKAN
jgi:hypothetical protein